MPRAEQVPASRLLATGLAAVVAAGTALGLVACAQEDQPANETRAQSPEPESPEPESPEPRSSATLEAQTAAIRGLGTAPTGWPSAVRVVTGAEALSRSDFVRLAGRRVGLITNATGVTSRGHLADLLAAASQVELVRLFGPEHGVRGAHEAGEHVEDGVDAATGVPVSSLYGSAKSPSAEALAGLDVLIFDLQDIGARFYTYIATMGLAMQAAAAHGVELLVLDRPNPLGGDRVEGYVLGSRDRSLVSMYPIPIVHGLTLGELARMIQGERWLGGLEGLELEVVEMQGWSRSMTWFETGLSWIPPSPNIPDPETALIYPGTCLFEGTVWSEGRGTEAPFLNVGGLGVDGEAIVSAVAESGASSSPGRASREGGPLGTRLEASRFTPVSIPGKAASPKGEGKELGGVRIRVESPRDVEPVRIGVSLLRAFLDQASTAESQGAAAADFLDAAWLDRLAGTERLRTMLLEGASVDQIVESWSVEVATFRQLREPYLLYE